MKRNYGFILGASDDIDRRTLQYLLNPPKLWEPEPSQIDRSHVTLSLPKDSAMSRSSLVTQRYHLISGILAEDSSRDHFSNICDSQKQPEEKKVDVSPMHLRNRQQGHLLTAGSGQRRGGKRWGDCRVGGVTNGGICAHRVERTIVTETNTTTGTRKWLTLNGTIYAGKS